MSTPHDLQRAALERHFPGEVITDRDVNCFAAGACEVMTSHLAETEELRRRIAGLEADRARLRAMIEGVRKTATVLNTIVDLV